MRESIVELRLSTGVRKMNGMSIKIAPIMAGVPDRLILLPGGRLFLIEVKAEGGRLRRIQRIIHDRIRSLGTEVVVLTGPEEVDVWLHQQEGEA